MDKDFLKEFEPICELEDRLLSVENVKKKKIRDQKTPERFKSRKSCTLYEFISMLQKVTERTIGQKYDIIFSPNEGKVPINAFSEQLNESYIVYRLISREPMKELSYRIRETIVESDEDGEPVRQGEVLGQKQKVYIQFDFFSSTVQEVEDIMNKFEENMILYTGYFMSNGVGKILFSKQLTDKSLDQFRQNTSVRSLIYYVELEKLIEKFDDDIVSIDVYNVNKDKN